MTNKNVYSNKQQRYRLAFMVYAAKYIVIFLKKITNVLLNFNCLVAKVYLRIYTLSRFKLR